jgi:hypothetical protein
MTGVLYFASGQTRANYYSGNIKKQQEEKNDGKSFFHPID